MLLQHTGDVALLIARLSRASDEREAREEAASATARPAPTTAATAPPKKRKLAPWEARELEQVTAQMEELEAELVRIDQRLFDAALYTTARAELEPLRTRRAACESKIAELYARWEALEG